MCISRRKNAIFNPKSLIVVQLQWMPCKKRQNPDFAPVSPTLGQIWLSLSWNQKIIFSHEMAARHLNWTTLFVEHMKMTKHERTVIMKCNVIIFQKGWDSSSESCNYESLKVLMLVGCGGQDSRGRGVGLDQGDLVRIVLGFPVPLPRPQIAAPHNLTHCKSYCNEA